MNMKKRIFLFVLLAIGMGSLQICAKKKAEKRSIVRIETTMGNIRVALFDDTPIHRDNFLELAGKGFYDGTLFHRVINEFMVQGGDPDSRTAQPGQLLGDGDNGYTLQPEFCLPFIYHWRGALAAAREGDDVNPEQRSSGCQFYIVYGKKQSESDMKKVRARLAPMDIEITSQMAEDYRLRGGTPHLDGQYTVFGEVIEGLEVVQMMQVVPTDSNDRPLKDVRITRMVIEQKSNPRKK